MSNLGFKIGAMNKPRFKVGQMVYHVSFTEPYTITQIGIVNVCDRKSHLYHLCNDSIPVNTIRSQEVHLSICVDENEFDANIEQLSNL